MRCEVVFTKEARQDASKLASAGLRTKAQSLLGVLGDNPLQNPAPFEKLDGELSGAFPRSINVHHRLVSQAFDKGKVVKVIRMWTHCE